MGSVFNEKWNVRGITALGGGGEKGIGFGHTELQILLMVGNKKIKLRKEFGARVRGL